MRNNLLIKILVLIIAILLWVQQTLQKNHEIEINLPIILKNLPAQYTVEQSEFPEITVSIKAKGFDLLFSRLSQLNFEVDASNFRYGKNQIILSKKNINYPKRANLDILNINYDNDLFVNVDKVVEKMKPVEIVFATADDESFFIANKITNEKQRVLVKGPQEIINKIDVIKTEPITQKMISNNKITANLLTPDPKISLDKKQVVFNVTQTKIINKTISLIPIKFPETEKITIIPQKVSVMISGPEDIVENLTNYSFEAHLDLQNIKKGFTGVTFDLPSGVKLIEYTPQRIQVSYNE